MLLGPGNWIGKGACRHIDAAVVTRFEVAFSLREEDGVFIDARLEIAGVAAPQSLTAWIVADECGGYAMDVKGIGGSFEGVAKLDSEPHLGLLWSQDGAHATFALFTLRETLGLRGFARSERGAITWELALRPQAEAVFGDNVVAFDAARRRR